MRSAVVARPAIAPRMTGQHRRDHQHLDQGEARLLTAQAGDQTAHHHFL
jgi:hypothetical protein